MRRFPTRTQILVVVFLLTLALGVGIAISAIQKVRSAAALMTCTNNLKQLGMALQNYDSANGHLPQLTDKGKGSKLGGGLISVFYEIAYYIETAPLFDYRKDPPGLYHSHSSAEYSFSYYAKSSPLIVRGGLANQCSWTYFIDPSDPTAHQLRDIPMTLPDGSTGYYATGSYAANGQLPWGKDTLAKLPANTILFAERPQVCKTASGESTYNLWGVGFYSPHMPAFAALALLDSPESWNTGQIAPIRPLPGEANADQLRVRIGREDAAPQPPDFKRPFQRIDKDEPCDPRLPGTPHRSGMPCAMADGSVRVFSHGTSPWLFWSACVLSVQEAEGK